MHLRGVNCFQPTTDTALPAPSTSRVVWCVVCGTMKHMWCVVHNVSLSNLREVHETDELLRSHVSQDFPDRFALYSAPEVPETVDNPGHGHRHDSFLWAQPSHLALVVDPVEPGSHLVKYLLAVRSER